MYATKRFAEMTGALLLAVTTAQADVIHVDANATGPADGTSWCTAYRDLQDALTIAEDGDEVRVANGTYRPDYGTGDVFIAFELYSGVILRGGYAGCGAANPDAHDPDAYETILSGDLAGDDDPDFTHVDDNSFHVVTTHFAGPDTLLEGVTVTGGNANGPCCTFDRGGGMLNYAGAPVIRNCAFRTNGGTQGGAIYLNASDATVENCVFENNRTAVGGGAILAYNSVTAIRTCAFSGNASAASSGGAVGVANSSIDLLDSTFHGNSAISGAAVALGSNSGGTIRGCTFQGNHAGGGNGAVYLTSVAKVVIEACNFEANTTGGSGAALMTQIRGEVELNACVFADNVAEGSGGALMLAGDELVARDCVFRSNIAGGAGGAAIVQSADQSRFLNCRFEGNSAERGGAVYAVLAGDVVFTRCTFLANEAVQDDGGAFVLSSDVSATLANCRVLGNVAASRGGGVFMYGDCRLTAVNTLFSGNRATHQGGGAYHAYQAEPRYLNCAFIGNDATTSADSDGIYDNAASPTLINCLLWNNDGANSWNQIYGGSESVSHSCVQGGFPGTANTGADPLLFDPDGPDDVYGTIDDSARILPGSACINAGSNGALPADVADVDDDGDVAETLPIDLTGHARILCDLVDIGAYEFGLGDIDCNQIIDAADFAAWDDCFTGPAGAPYPGDCIALDADHDNRVDLRDFAALQVAAWALIAP